MVTRSPSPRMTPHCPSHQLACLTGVSSKDSLPLRAIDNVFLPFRIRDDDDESDTDFDDERIILNPPYPSYLWEIAEARARQHFEAVQHDRAIVTWNSRISIG